VKNLNRTLYFALLVFGFMVLGFSILKVRGLSPEKWISFKKEDDVYGELEYLKDNLDWAKQLGVDRWNYWSATTDAKRAIVLFAISKSRAVRADEVLNEGHWFLSMHMRRKGSIYALEGIKLLESGYKKGDINREAVSRYRAEIEEQLVSLNKLKLDRQDLIDIQGNTRENLEIVLKQLKAIENS
jgi:hypothetical protein